jgi:enoyl-CoA hydratase/carnithine racemase
VVVLTGTGDKAFMAGADLKEFQGMIGNKAAIEEHVYSSFEVFAELARLPQPTVAAVQAHALGGGLEVALTCDLIVAEPGIRLGLPEVRLGLIPGAGGTQRLPRRIGDARAREIILLGGNVDTDEALRIGLVNRVSAPGAVLEEARALAAKLAALPGQALRNAKAALADDLQAGLDRERELFLEVFATEDVREGLNAFLERRQPAFAHR